MLAQVNGGYHLGNAPVPFRESFTENWHFLQLAPMCAVK
jgi:hypothetical protein